jgi:hypothetical protein
MAGRMRVFSQSDVTGHAMATVPNQTDSAKNEQTDKT